MTASPPRANLAPVPLKELCKVSGYIDNGQPIAIEIQRVTQLPVGNPNANGSCSAFLPLENITVTSHSGRPVNNQVENTMTDSR